MTDAPPPDDENSPSGDAGGPQPESHEIRHSQISALVPDRVRRGVFSTGAVVLQGPHEFIIDFLLRMTRPHQVAARVVMPPRVVDRFIVALRENLSNYEKTFGGPPAGPPAAAGTTSPAELQAGNPPAPAASPAGHESGAAGGSPTAPAPHQEGPKSISDQSTAAQDLYDQLKLPDDVISGAYANAVMIGHTATEFSFDFITTFFPRSAVSCRVYLAAPNARRFLDSLVHSFEQYQRKLPGRPPAGDSPE